MLSSCEPVISTSPCIEFDIMPDVPSNRCTMSTDPAPMAVRSSVIDTRVLLGAFERISIGPDRSPPGVDTVAVPVARRVVSLPRASAPPMACKYFATMSSTVGVWAWGRAGVPAATSPASASTVNQERLGMIRSSIREETSGTPGAFEAPTPPARTALKNLLDARERDFHVVLRQQVLAAAILALEYHPRLRAV